MMSVQKAAAPDQSSSSADSLSSAVRSWAEQIPVLQEIGLRLWSTFFLAFTALLPIINPVGSALIFLGLVGDAPIDVYRSLARRIAVNNIIFLAVIEVLGSSLLKFFGISLPIVQVSGGLVIVGIGWSMLNDKDAHGPQSKSGETGEARKEADAAEFADRSFYPFTFPITSGPGTLVVTLTLSAHAADRVLVTDVLAHVGLFLAIVVLSAMIYFCYAYAPRLTRAFSPSTVNGVVRVMAFIVLCIGAQIAWNGLTTLLASR